MMTRATQSEEPLAAAGADREPAAGQGGHRLANLNKLYHVPVFALRDLLQRRVAGRKFSGLDHDGLVAAADRLSDLSEADVEQLYENYRYGRSLAFYIYLLPEGVTEPALENVQAILDELAVADQPVPEGRVSAGEDYERETPPDQIVLMDEERLDGIREIRFRYYVAHHFLDVNEQPTRVLQTRYGFLWLDLNLGYLCILSRDERVNRLLTRALAGCLQVIPLPVRFPKELVDKHFSIEKAMRVSHYDPGTGVRQSISGQDLWNSYQEEILEREQRYVRPSSLYQEEVAAGVVSGLGVTASKGKIYLTKALPTSLVRAWGVRRLPELVRDLKALRDRQPEYFNRSVETINRMRLSAVGKTAILDIAEGLLRARREGAKSIALSRTALDIYQALAGKYFKPYLRAPCCQCQELAQFCPYCASPKLIIEGSSVTCGSCGALLSDGESVTLGCMEGHTTTVSLGEAFGIAPNHWLQKRMARVFEELGLTWDEQADYFHIEGPTLYALRREETCREELPPVVQGYLARLWRHSPPPPPSEQVGPAGRTYRDFDLRIRGNAAVGYTVEAAVLGGGSVSTQPLPLPSDAEFQQRLVRILHQNVRPQDLQAVGGALFGALFPTPILKLWSRAKGGLGERDGIRIRLHIDPPELMALPWELLYEEGFLGLRLRFPIVRYLDLPEPPQPLTVKSPLRVLVAVSQPADMLQLDVEAELSSIQRALDQLADRVEMEVLEFAGRETLLAQLRKGYHILHFVGHGMFDRGEGYLILEDVLGRSDPMAASVLGQLVADSNLRLVVLNACETAISDKESGFGGTAHQLVRAGMPAVVAMQLAIADRTAVAFSREFYGALADGWPVDAAVQEGRRSILITLGNRWQEYVDWAIPTLYMRAPDGVILGF